MSNNAYKYIIHYGRYGHKFLLQLKEIYAKPIVLVLDNAKYQHCNAVKQKAQELGITLLFLPSYSPNLNILKGFGNSLKTNIVC